MTGLCQSKRILREGKTATIDKSPLTFTKRYNWWKSILLWSHNQFHGKPKQILLGCRNTQNLVVSKWKHIMRRGKADIKDTLDSDIHRFHLAIPTVHIRVPGYQNSLSLVWPKRRLPTLLISLLIMRTTLGSNQFHVASHSIGNICTHLAHNPHLAHNWARNRQ